MCVDIVLMFYKCVYDDINISQSWDDPHGCFDDPRGCFHCIAARSKLPTCCDIAGRHTVIVRLFLWRFYQ